MDTAVDPSPKPRRRNLWSPLGNGDFTLLWTSGVATSISTVLRTLVGAQWLYDQTGSAAQLGLLGIVQLIQLPLVLYGGTLADLIDRKKLMAMTQGAFFLMLAVLTFLAAAEALRPWHIFAATGLGGIVSMLGSPARPAMLPRVVPRESLTQGVTIQILTRQVSSVGAPLLFWQSYEALGVTTSFGIAAGFALASAVAPLLMRASGKPSGTATHREAWTSFKEGFRFLRSHRILPALYLLDTGVVIFTFYRQLFPVFADQLYGLGASGTGLLSAADAAGSIVGTLLVLYADRVRRKGVLVLGATAVYAVMLFAFGTVSIFAVGLGIVAVLGAMDSVSAAMRQAIVQLTTPDKLLGRSSSVQTFAAMGPNHLGQTYVGMMSGLIGAGGTILLGGVLSLVVIAAVWQFVPSIRRYRFDPKDPYEKFEAPARQPQAASTRR